MSDTEEAMHAIEAITRLIVQQEQRFWGAYANEPGYYSPNPDKMDDNMREARETATELREIREKLEKLAPRLR